MPSSHSQFMCFFATYVTLYLVFRYPPSPHNYHLLFFRTHKFKLWLRCVQSLLVIMGSGTVCMTRIYLRYHTARQVLCGGGIGVLLGLMWYLTVGTLRILGVVDWVLGLPI